MEGFSVAGALNSQGDGVTCRGRELDHSFPVL